MNKAVKNVCRGGLVAALMGISFFATSGSAQAYSYDGQNPASTGCGSDATTMESARMVNHAGVDFGVIELRYSINCHTAWARLTLDDGQQWCGNASAGYACSTATIVRNNDGRAYTCTIYTGQHQCYTAMVYDKGLTSYARGVHDSATGIADVRTASY
jgi:hypothetical protein